ncbi:MAG: tail fiber protein [Blastocatellia bacterium]|nr:tail fiber protein [Blastocatellia bacterium]
MSEPFIGEVKIAGFGIVPKGWALCNGSLLAINQYQALFSILGTTYGGNGTTNFALPDLRGRAPLGTTGQFPEGMKGGEEAHVLTVNEIPSHTHSVVASGNGPDQAAPAGGSWSTLTENLYTNSAPGTPMNPAAVSTTGSSQPHPNMPPYLALNYIIALTGIFPPRS